MKVGDQVEIINGRAKNGIVTRIVNDTVWCMWPGEEVALWSSYKDLKVVNKKSEVKNMEIVNMKRLSAAKVIDDQKGKFFTAKFKTKHTGVLASVNGRTGVVKFLKTKNQHPEKEDLKNAFNVHVMEYRNIYLDGIREIRAAGKRYIFE